MINYYLCTNDFTLKITEKQYEELMKKFEGYTKKEKIEEIGSFTTETITYIYKNETYLYTLTKFDMNFNK